jgi:hypothetical protein
MAAIPYLAQLHQLVVARVGQKQQPIQEPVAALEAVAMVMD